VCDLEVIGSPSIFNVICSIAVLVRILSTLDLNCEENTTICSITYQETFLTLQNIGQFPDEPVRIKGVQIHYVNTQTY
jgi:hypothetical protein